MHSSLLEPVQDKRMLKSGLQKQENAHSLKRKDNATTGSKLSSYHKKNVNSSTNLGMIRKEIGTLSKTRTLASKKYDYSAASAKNVTTMKKSINLNTKYDSLKKITSPNRPIGSVSNTISSKQIAGR